jgi:multiple sugar transport system substrate-binding protein
MRHTGMAAVACAALAAAALAGCSSGGSGSGGSGSSASTQLTFLNFYPQAAVQTLIGTYEKTHPGVTITDETVPIADLDQTVETRLANKSSQVDLYMADQPRISELYSRGDLLNVSSTVPSTSIWLPSSVGASTVDGHLVAYPVNTSDSVMFYNESLLDKAHIPLPSTNPADRLTWQQMVTEAKEAQAAGAKWGFQFDQVNLYYALESLPVSAGGGTGLTGTNNLTPDVTDAGWQKAMTFYQSLYSGGVAEKGLTSDQTAETFADGQVAFYVGPTSDAATWAADNVKFQWGVAPQPYFAGGTAVTPTGAWSIGINPNSKHIAAAEAFAKWISTTAQGDNAYLNVDDGIPALQSQDAAYLSAGIWGQGTPGQTPGDLVKYDLAHTAVDRPTTLGYIEFETIMDNTFADIGNGVSVSSALQSAQSQLTSAFAQLPSS